MRGKEVPLLATAELTGPAANRPVSEPGLDDLCCIEAIVGTFLIARSLH
jgi:hypothetical protein